MVFFFSDLVAWLEKEHGIQTRLMPINVMGSMLRQFDFHRNRILLSEAMPEEQTIVSVMFTSGFSYISATT